MGLVFGGIVIGGVVYHVIVMRRMQPVWRRTQIARELAAAQMKHERRRIASGPEFPRAAMHVARIAERGEQVLRAIEAAPWNGPSKTACIEEMNDLLRHCRELASAMQPKRRRTDRGSST